ncbi:MAG: CTP synthase [Pirellulales bacterium]
MIRIGLIGDRDDSITAHRAIPAALSLCAARQNLEIEPVWLATDTISPEQLHEFEGIWCVPGSPYRNAELAIASIRFAREHKVPFFGTCGGFQHALIEYARNVLGWTNAEHAETHPEGGMLVISPLTCSLVEVTDHVHLVDGSLLAAAYGSESISISYHCRYGLNAGYAAQLTSGPFKVAAWDSNHEVRAMELIDHPFFVTTLFQPERAALDGICPPIVESFIRSCVARAEDGGLAP